MKNLENELFLLDEKTVNVVQPDFGNVSHSRIGKLSIIFNKNSNLKSFLFTGISYSMIFTISDVWKIENHLDLSIEKIIRLKGPSEYIRKFSLEEIPIGQNISG